MIVQRNGETFKVDVQKEIEVILYFPKLEDSKKEEPQGSMTDKGKELIDKAREVNLQKLGKVDASKADVKQQLEDCLSNYNSTRHKSKDGETHNTNLPLKIDLGKDWYKGVIGDSLRTNSDFREDRLSEAQVKQFDKDFVKIECEGLPEKVKEASLRFGSQPKSVEELLFNLSSAGKKEKEGKLYYELSWEFIEAMAKRMADNKGDKYERYNWKKNIDIEDLKQAINRHHIEVMKGNYDDGQEFLGHIVSYATNSMMLWEQLNKN